MADVLDCDVSDISGNDMLASDLQGKFFYDERGFKGKREEGLFRQSNYFYVTSLSEKGLDVQYVDGPKVLYDFEVLTMRLKDFSSVSDVERHDLEQEQRNAYGILS